MDYNALYRKYRSQTFEEIAGQQHIVKTLQNALINNRIGHAYIFSGPRGTGKTSMARLFAKALNCEEEFGHICNECESCKLISQGMHPDVVEFDAASNSSVDEIRNIIESSRYSPIRSKYKIYIIDEAHMLSKAAFNALLKTLEEPPEHVIFILATTEPHKIIPTIVSRCQRFDFTRLSDIDLENQLKYVCSKEEITIDEEAIKEIVALADGGVRDALSMLDQLCTYCLNHISYDDVLRVFGLVAQPEMVDFISNILQKNTNIVLNKLYNYNEQGINIKKLNEDLIIMLKDALIYKTTSNYSILHLLTEQQAIELSTVSTLNRINEVLDTFIKCSNEFKFAANIRTFYEIAILRVAGSNVEEQISEYVKPVEQPIPQVTIEPIKEVQPTVSEENNAGTAGILEQKVVEPVEETVKEEPIKVEEPIVKETEETEKYIEPKKVSIVNPEDLITYSDDILIRAATRSSKTKKLELFNKWSKLNELIVDPKYAQFIPMLKNCTLFIFCNELLVLQTQFDSIIKAINHKDNQEAIIEIIKYISGLDLKVYALSLAEGRRITIRYVNLQQLNKLPKLNEEESIFNE